MAAAWEYAQLMIFREYNASGYNYDTSLSFDDPDGGSALLEQIEGLDDDLKRLNRLGQDGWEVVSNHTRRTDDPAGGFRFQREVLFKRPTRSKGSFGLLN